MNVISIGKLMKIIMTVFEMNKIFENFSSNFIIKNL